jgi:hypothetical protein
MNRFLLWLIPLLAAICAIWVQSALHGYPTGRLIRYPSLQSPLQTQLEGQDLQSPIVPAVNPVYPATDHLWPTDAASHHH